MTFIDYDTPDIECPGCAKELGGALATTEGQTEPDDGSIAVCAECGTISVYTAVNDKLELRYPTDDEMVVILKNMHIARVIAVTRLAREMRE